MKKSFLSQKVLYSILLITLVILATNVILIANPGYFNHDELQKADHILLHGFGEFVKSYCLNISPSLDFGTPIRPIGFLIQGILGKFIYTSPLVAHAVDIALHLFVTIGLFGLIYWINQSNLSLALLSAVLYAFSPLTTYSVGWIGASMDRLYVLFTLAALFMVLGYHKGYVKPIQLIGIMLATIMALLSKETAVMLPVIVAIFYIAVCKKPENSLRESISKLLPVLLAVSLPVMAYVAYRAPALIHSFSVSQTSTPYAASVSNILSGLSLYWSYPFIHLLGEAVTFPAFSMPMIVFASLFHAALLYFIFRQFGWRLAMYYLAGYFLPLIPVLPIAIKGSHYLYASGLVFSIALAALILNIRQFSVTYKILIGLLVIIPAIHGINNQVKIYSVGHCMNKAMISLDSQYKYHAKNHFISSIFVVPDKNAPTPILDRIFTGRNQIGKDIVEFHIVSDQQKLPSDKSFTNEKLYLNFSTDCLMY